MELIKNNVYDIEGYKHEYLGFYIDYYDNKVHTFKAKKPFSPRSCKVGIHSDFDERILTGKLGLSKTELVTLINDSFLDKKSIKEENND